MKTKTLAEVHLAGRACRTSLIVSVGNAGQGHSQTALLKQITANQDRGVMRVIRTVRS